MTQAEFARRKGVSRQAINDLVTRGIIPLINGKIDPDVAELKMQQHLDPGRARTLGNEPEPTPSAPPAASAPASPDAPEKAMSYQAARTMREIAEAKRSQINLQREMGVLVDRAGVERAAMDAGRLLRDTQAALASRLAPKLATMTDTGEIRTLLETELRRSAEQMADRIRSGMLRVSADV